MAIEIRYIFGAVSILLGLVWISGFNGSIADRFDPYTRVRITSDPYSDFTPLRQTKFNDTSVDGESGRTIIYERGDSRVPNQLRNFIGLNFRSYLREENSRNEEVFNRNRWIGQLHFENSDSNRRYFDIHRVRNRRISSASHRRERISDDLRYRLEKLPFNSFERIRFDARNFYRDESKGIRFDRQFRKDYFRIDRQSRSFRRHNRNLSSRRLDPRMGREDERKTDQGTQISRKTVFRMVGNNLKDFFLYVWDWGSLINTYLAGISNYLFTIIAGLFIFDTLGQFIPVKTTEEKGFLNLFHNFASVTGNVIVH